VVGHIKLEDSVMSVRPFVSLLVVSVAVYFSAGSAMMKPHGTFRMVKKTPEGGVLALVGDPALAHAEAEKAMAAQCGQYKILAEEEVVVGSNTDSSTHTSANRGGSSQGTATATRDATETRITFACGGAPAAPAADPKVAAPAGEPAAALAPPTPAPTK
jgi:hypothetical protein